MKLDERGGIEGCSIIYAPRGQAGEYAPLATNPYRGCGHQCAYCLDPSTPIQMADGTVRPLSAIEIGDDVLGVIQHDQPRKWTFAPSRVLARLDTIKPALRITLVNGMTAICSEDHRWLTECGWEYAYRITTNTSISTAPAFESSRVVSIKHLGKEIPMLDITTSTENFIAAGMISHNCYVPNVLRMSRAEFDAGANGRPDFIRALRKDAAKYQAAGITGQVMLSFTTDPYHPGDTALTTQTLESLQEYGLGICTLTKGGTRALRDINLFRPGRDAFASTLTSLDDAFSRKWERAAALPGDRLAALKAFRERGIFTWVSLEPTLDVESSLAIVEATHGFVDLYKVGRVNYLPMTKTTDWRSYTLRMTESLQRLGKRHYIKADLQKYLPAGYHNPLRVTQHH